MRLMPILKKKKSADSNLIVHGMGWESLQRRRILFGALGRPQWASPATSGQRLWQQLLMELHVRSSQGTAAVFVCFCSSLNKWLIRNWAKNDTQHKTGRCLVLLKCARDVVRGKGDAVGGNIVFPREIWLFNAMENESCFVSWKVRCCNPSASFLGGAAGEREKSRCVTVCLRQYFGAVNWFNW